VFGVLVRRLFSALPVLLIVSLISFGLMRLIPGDPAAAIAGIAATAERRSPRLRRDLGPGPAAAWMQLIATFYAKGWRSGDLGRSLLLGIPVFAATMVQRCPVTIGLSPSMRWSSRMRDRSWPAASSPPCVRPQSLGRPARRRCSRMIGDVACRTSGSALVLIVLFAVGISAGCPTGGYVPFSQDFDAAGCAARPCPPCSLALLQAGLLDAHHPVLHARSAAARTISAPRAPRGCRTWIVVLQACVGQRADAGGDGGRA
jgi:peptide/nickel transport system permease protein